MILVTGHRGFIGQHLTKTMDRLDFKWIGFDLANGQDTRRKLDIETVFDSYPIDTVIHLAALSGARRGNAYPQEYFDTNVIGTENVARTCEKFGVKKLIVFSSASAKSCQNTYGITKKTMELMLERIKLDQLFIVRPFNVYGEKGRPDQVIYKWKARIEAGLPIEFHGNMRRNYTYVGDIVNGVIGLLKSNETGTTLDFGNSTKYDLSSLLELFREKYPNMVVVEKKLSDIEVSPEGDFECNTDFIEKAKELI